MVAKRILRWTGLTVLFFGFAACVALGSVAAAYHGKFYPGVQVAGISLSGKTEAEGRQIIAAHAARYTSRPITISVTNFSQPKDAAGSYPDLSVEATAGQLGLEVPSDLAADKAWAVGHGTNLVAWVRSVVPSLFASTSIALPYSLNRTTVQNYASATLVPEAIAPVPAKLVVDAGVATVTPAQPGLTLDTAPLADLVAASVTGGVTDAPLRLRLPATQADSPVQVATVQPLADKLNTVGATKLSLVGEGIALRPTRAQLVSWYQPVQDAQGAISLVPQKDAVFAYLKQAGTVDTDKSVDPVVAKLAVLAATPSPSLSVVVTPTTKAQGRAVTTAGSYTSGRFPGKYVEVNLAEQKLYQVDGTTLINTFLISSGKASTPTPVGQFYIGNKAPRALSSLYGLYMPWWESFLNNTYGLHELPEWPGGYKEGEGHLGIPVSDGCVRLGIGAAKELYDWTETGTPVYIH